MVLININKFGLIMCLFLLLSITPASASLQSDLNTTNRNDTNSLIEKLQNPKTKSNNTTFNNGININNSQDLLTSPNFVNESQLLNDMAQIVEYRKDHNITVRDDNNTILGTIIKITSINDLKPGDIITYFDKVKGIVNSIPFYLLITSIKGKGEQTTYTYYTVDPNNPNNIIHHMDETQEKFKNFLSYEVNGSLVFRSDPSLYNLTADNTTINPKDGDELQGLLKNFNKLSIELETNDNQIVPSTAKDVLWLWGLIPGFTTAIQLPFTWKLLVQKYRKCCCNIPSPEDIALLRQTNQLGRLSEWSSDVSVAIERLNGDIRVMLQSQSIEVTNVIEITRVETELSYMSAEINRIDISRFEREMRVCLDPTESIKLSGQYEVYRMDITLKRERIVELERRLKELRQLEDLRRRV